jgi:hypothetical protein
VSDVVDITYEIVADRSLVHLSNLTFGAGGKDKDGKHVAGWGYYEVRALAHHRDALCIYK